MTKASTTDLIGKVSLFRDLDADIIASIVSDAQKRSIAHDAFYFHEGDPAALFYVLVQGRIKLVQTTAEGHQVVLRIIAPGNMFGGIAAFSNTVYPASAQAITDSESLSWDGKAMTRIIERYPSVALRALEHLALTLHEVQDRYRELATERVERRVARALIRLVRQSGRKTREGVLIDMPLSRQDLAEMTGTTLFTISRILSDWEQKSLVKSGRKRVVIIAPHAIVALAEDLPGIPPEVPTTDSPL